MGGLVWLLLILLLAVVFGIGTVLEAAFWLLVLLALAVAAGTFLLSRAIAERT